MKSVFCTAGNVWWGHSTAWAMSVSCSHCAGLLCWVVVAKKSWASIHNVHTLSCPLSRYKLFAASWVHWGACIQAKVCNSHELSLVPQLETWKPCLLSEVAYCQGLWQILLFCLSVWSAIDAIDHVLILLHSQLHPIYPLTPSLLLFISMHICGSTILSVSPLRADMQ